jgi:quercetin dioxygenase-like cupin family protein
MTYFATFEPPDATGFRLVAGRPNGLRRLLVASGRIAVGAPSQVHLHRGDEVIRIVSGEVIMRVADERRTCRAGDIVVVPPDTLHGFRVVAEAIMEVIAEQDIGTFWPVRQDDGTRHLVQIFTPSPWNPAPPGGEYTSEEDLELLRRRIDIDV